MTHTNKGKPSVTQDEARGALRPFAKLNKNGQQIGDIRPHLSDALEALRSVRPGEVVEIGAR
jgi:hypothetical protein